MKPTLIEVLLALYPFSTPDIDWKVDQVNDTHEITYWDEGKLGVKPNSSTIATKFAELYHARLAARIRTRREEIINDGVTVPSGGRDFYCDDKSQNDMQKALTLMQLAQISEILWSGDGWMGALTYAQLVTAAVQVGGFVQQSFARRADLLTQLAALPDGDQPGFAQTVEAFWLPV